QEQLVEYGGDLVQPEGSLTLTCKASGLDFSKGRFTITRSTSLNTVTLQLNSLTAADTAT
nr:Ig heavy chain V-a region (p26.9b1) - rabbit (fragments) [Oryctolagus cuniculus]